MEMGQETTILIMGLAFVFGIVLTGIYYFARYWFKTEDEKKNLEAPQPPDTNQRIEAKPTPETSLQNALKGTRESFWGKIQKSLSAAGDNFSF